LVLGLVWLSGTARRLAFAAATLAGGVALFGAVVTSSWASRAGVWGGFFSALVIWGWHEQAFLLGIVTGPNQTACPPHARGWDRFRLATLTVIHHELALFLTLLGLAAALQAGSEHPLARAVTEAALAAGITPSIAEAIQAVPGRGVEGQLHGQPIRIASARWRDELGAAADPALAARATALQAAGRTVSWAIRVAEGAAELIGVLAFGDTIKPGAREAIERLHALGIATVMISGDNRGAAESVGRALGIGRVMAEVLPADKAACIEALRSGAQGGAVAMVGDGINDAPALAAADVGIAMATGTDVAMHTAGITLMRGDPRLVPAAIEISARTVAKIRQNLFWAFAYNVVGIPLAAFGLLSPVIAGAAMAMSSVSVMANALTLSRWPPRATRDDSARLGLAPSPHAGP
jgi:Cu+-exporting ATPase